MAQSPGLAGRVDRTGAFASSAWHTLGAECGAESAIMDWDLTRFPTNMLVIGTESTVSNLVYSLWSHFTGPVLVRRSGEPLQLPATSETLGTMIVRDVDTLTREEQRALHDWLTARSGRTRVLSTASASLLPLLDTRAFSDRLYYRLNTVCVDLRLSPRPGPVHVLDSTE